MAGIATAPQSAAIELAATSAELAHAKKELRTLQRQHEGEKAQLLQVVGARSVRSRVEMGISTATTVLVAGGGGALDAFLETKRSDKMGPVKFVTLGGLAAAIAGVLVNDGFAAELLSATGRGIAAPAVWNTAREWVMKRPNSPSSEQLAPQQQPPAKK